MVTLEPNIFIFCDEFLWDLYVIMTIRKRERSASVLYRFRDARRRIGQVEEKRKERNEGSGFSWPTTDFCTPRYNTVEKLMSSRCWKREAYRNPLIMKNNYKAHTCRCGAEVK